MYKCNVNTHRKVYAKCVLLLTAVCVETCECLCACVDVGVCASASVATRRCGSLSPPLESWSRVAVATLTPGSQAFSREPSLEAVIHSQETEEKNSLSFPHPPSLSHFLSLSSILL